jgi:hypothetical protein
LDLALIRYIYFTEHETKSEKQFGYLTFKINAMKKVKLCLSCFAFLSLMFNSCGGGGVSEEFTKEINEFETAWINTGISFSGIMDSVKTTNESWIAMHSEMKVPDTLVERLDSDKSKKLDSIKAICSSQNESCAAILKGLEEYKTGWDKETSAFAEWKDKVLKGEIDIETAKKDLLLYKTKLTQAGDKSTEAYNKLSELKIACSGTCGLFDQMVTSLATEEPEPKRRGR